MEQLILKNHIRQNKSKGSHELFKMKGQIEQYKLKIYEF